MNLVKKNIISILAGVVAVMALVLSFMPLRGMVAAHQEELDRSARTHRDMRDLLNRQRLLPMVDPDSTEQPALPVFPGEPVIKQGGQIVEELRKEGLALRDAAVQLNMREQLVPGLLPSPRTQTPLIEFRDRYRRLFQPNGLPALMRGSYPPTDEDIKRRQEELARKITDEELMIVGDRAVNQQQVQEKIKERWGRVPDEVRAEIANKSLTYILPDTFDRVATIAGAGAPQISDVFEAQVKLWIQQDVAKAVADTNGRYSNVIEAPVKRLISVRFPMPWIVSSPDVPRTGNKDEPIGRSVAVSPTGRVSNSLHDVVHFTVEVDVEAAKLAMFLRELTRNRFITPLQMDITTVDSALMLGQGYVYGPEPVVNVVMQCEALLLREWLEPLMPAAVKRQLVVEEPRELF